MNIPLTTAVLGLGAAAIWGAADFTGGVAARHLRVFWLLAISHSFSLALLLVLAEVFHQPAPDAHILMLGLVSGIAGGSALLIFYHALSLGEMGVTAAITGLLTAALPVIFTLITVGSPSLRQMAGFALAAVAIWLISSRPAVHSGSPSKLSTNNDRKRFLLALISGVGFGTFLIFLRQANSGGLIWPLAASRVGSLTLAFGFGLLLSRHRFTVVLPGGTHEPDRRGQWKIGVALALFTSLCDTGGNFLFIAATRIGRLDIAAVLSSFYPASTIALAVWILKERTSRRQGVGMVMALVAAGLIT